jgi:hypothetical protein
VQDQAEEFNLMAGAPAPLPAPALVFSESNPAPAGPAADCSDAVSLGDTHLTTFGGLLYDFQATGDFLLAETGPEFLVQTRQASADVAECGREQGGRGASRQEPCRYLSSGTGFRGRQVGDDH